MTVLLLGANGQLGQTFLEDGRLAKFDTIVAATRDGKLLDGTACAKVDLTSMASLSTLLDEVAPDTIVNTAAYNAVDRAEDEPDLARRINCDAIGELGEWAARHGARVVHYSSDYVFDGEKSTPYLPADRTCPLGAYGKSKRDGEIALARSGAQYMLFRTSWVYSAFGSNFMKTMLRLANDRDQVRVVSDQHGTPTSARLIVEGTLRALESEGSTSVLEHLVASESTTWWEFANAIFDEALDAGLLTKLPTVVPISTSEFDSRAQRPRFSVLDNSGFHRRYQVELPHWREPIRKVIHSLKAQSGDRAC